MRPESQWENKRKALHSIHAGLQQICSKASMIYGSETWEVEKCHEQRLEMTEMRMLRWTIEKRKTIRDRVRKTTIREMAEVMEVSRKV